MSEADGGKQMDKEEKKKGEEMRVEVEHLQKKKI